jgi:hypothetical protein
VSVCLELLPQYLTAGVYCNFMYTRLTRMFLLNFNVSGLSCVNVFTPDAGSCCAQSLQILGASFGPKPAGEITVDASTYLRGDELKPSAVGINCKYAAFPTFPYIPLFEPAFPQCLPIIQDCHQTYIHHKQCSQRVYPSKCSHIIPSCHGSSGIRQKHPEGSFPAI